MNYDRFKSWEDEIKEPKKAPSKPEPKKVEPKKPKSPEDIFESIWSLAPGKSVTIEMDADTFNKVYSNFRGAMKSNRPSYKDGKLIFTKKIN